MKLNKVIAIPVLALAGGLGLGACGNQAAPHAAPAVTHAVTAAPAPTTPAPTTAAPAPVVVVPAPAKTVYVPPPAPVGPSGVNCGADQNGYGVYAGANTSCPFALDVAADYNGAAYDAGPQVITVYSPVTGLNYSMTYTWSDGFITAIGGNDASVQFIG